VRRYVVCATAAVSALALSFDVIQQLIFFQTWSIALRSWGITLGMAVVIAAPIFGEVARWQLKLARANARLQRLSDTDPLTGLMNRRALLNFAALLKSENTMLILLDLDRFKRINDRHGHLMGDLVLKNIATRLREEFGEVAAVCRFGGEEFAIMCVPSDPRHFIERVKNFRARIEDMPIVAQGAALRVTLSAGITSGSGADFERLYAEADSALYEAKAAGRNRVLVSRSGDRRRCSPASHHP
jgi:diguanylate cyclase (GGDEF)-like protein